MNAGRDTTTSTTATSSRSQRSAAACTVIVLDDSSDDDYNDNHNQPQKIQQSLSSDDVDFKTPKKRISTDSSSQFLLKKNDTPHGDEKKRSGPPLSNNHQGWSSCSTAVPTDSGKGRGLETPRQKKRRYDDGNFESVDLEDFESPEIFFEKVYQRHMSPKTYSGTRTGTRAMSFSSPNSAAEKKSLADLEESPSRRVYFPHEKTAKSGNAVAPAVAKPQLQPQPQQQKVTKPSLLYDSSDDEHDLMVSRVVAPASADREKLNQREMPPKEQVPTSNGNVQEKMATTTTTTTTKTVTAATTTTTTAVALKKSAGLSWIMQPPGPGEPHSFERKGIQWYWCEICNHNRGRWRTHSTQHHREKYSIAKKQTSGVTMDPGMNNDHASISSSSLMLEENRLSLERIQDDNDIAINTTKTLSSNKRHSYLTKCSALHLVSDSGSNDSKNESVMMHSCANVQYSKQECHEDEQKLLKMIEESIQRDRHHKTDVLKGQKIGEVGSKDEMTAVITSIKSDQVSNSVHEKAHQASIQNLRQMEKVLLKKHQGRLTFAIKESKKKDHSEFCYYIMRQFMFGHSSQGKNSISKQCLTCCHCSKQVHSVEKSKLKRQIKIFRRHLNRCKRTPIPIRAALHTLEKLEMGNRKKSGKTHEHKLIDNFEPSTKRSNLTVDKGSKDSDKELLTGRDLHEMYVFDRQKQLSADHYPTLTFTAWNDVKDYLYDFKVFVGPSRIPNAGNGAFLQLLRVRVRKPKIDYVIPITRCPLTFEDANGRMVKVFLGPNRIHDDFGPDNDDNYIEDNSIKFSSWDEGCGSIDIGSYGPFFPSDIKKESHYELKNFLFDFEPQGWSYGFNHCMHKDSGKKGSNDNFVLDITDDFTGEPHLRARENIPMHVNETGHNINLEVNVTPLEPEQGVHYYAHPKNPIGVGDTIELLVNYGDIYEEVRERKGYGKSTLGSDQIESQRVKRNQCERVKVEDFIMSENPEELYDILLSIRGMVDSILDLTDSCLNVTPVPENMRRQWTARFRMHWIETLFRKRFVALQSQMSPYLFSNMMHLLDKMKYNNNSKAHHMMINIPLVKELALKEIMEESIFLCSKKHRLLHPLDPSLWCALAQDIVHEIGQTLVFELKTGICNETQALEKIYRLAQDASTEVRNIGQTRKRFMRLAFKKTENDIIRKFLKMKITSSTEKVKPVLKHVKDKGADAQFGHLQYLARFIQAEETVEVAPDGIARSNIDIQWYMLCQVVRVVHVMVRMCLPTIAKMYSLERLCTSVEVAVSDAKIMLQKKMIEPYNEELYVSPYAESCSNIAIKHDTKRITATRVRQIGASGDRNQKMEERRQILLQGFAQTDNFIPNVHINVMQNRQSKTFWKEMPAGTDFPQGWIIHVHKRQNGATGGRFIDYYWFTRNGKKLRSRVEVKRFMNALELARGDEDIALGIFKETSIPRPSKCPNAQVNTEQTSKSQSIVSSAVT